MHQDEKQGRIVLCFQHFEKGREVRLRIIDGKRFIQGNVPAAEIEDLKEKIKKDESGGDQPGTSGDLPENTHGVKTIMASMFLPLPRKHPFPRVSSHSEVYAVSWPYPQGIETVV